MKKAFLFLIALLPVLSLSGMDLQAQEKVYMPFFEMINVHSDYQYSTARLLKNYIDEKKKYTLIIPQRIDTMASQLPANKIRDIAASLDCKYYIIGDLNRIGETVIISVSMYKTDDGVLYWSDRLKANTPDDIDPILQKISNAIGTQSKAAEDGSIYSVTNYESQPLKQIKANNYYGISIGSVLFTSKPFKDDPFTGGFGGFWLFDARNVMFEIKGEIYPLGKYIQYHASINAYYPFFAESNTPFVGGGLGLGASGKNLFSVSTENSDNYSGSGLLVFVGGGYTMGRASSVGIKVTGRYFIAIYSMSNPDKSIPNGFLLNMELYFDKSLF